MSHLYIFLKKLILQNLKFIINTFLRNRPKPFLVTDYHLNTDPLVRWQLLFNLVKILSTFAHVLVQLSNRPYPRTRLFEQFEPSAEVVHFPHTHPTTYRVSHVPPYKVYAKFKLPALACHLLKLVRNPSLRHFASTPSPVPRREP